MLEQWHGTTILGVKKGGRTVIAGDGQVSMGNTVMKPNAKKVRRIGDDGKVIGGFAGATADAFTLFERLEKKLTFARAIDRTHDGDGHRDQSASQDSRRAVSYRRTQRLGRMSWFRSSTVNMAA